MTAGYRNFRPRDEDPNDHASVAAMRARSEAVKADEAFSPSDAGSNSSGTRMRANSGQHRGGTKVSKIIRGE
jgi:hypothetical protein